MSAIYGLENVSSDMKDSAVAVGVFDGVHWGHRAIFRQLVDISSKSGIKAIAMTFDKHPAELLAPNAAPYYINTIDQRIELIKCTGVDEVVVAEFNHALAELTHEEFMQQILLGTLNARHIVVGSNFRFGKERRGDIRYMTAEAPKLGIEISVVPAVIINGGPVSSTRIRALISRGDVSDAAKLLGRRFILRGTVVSGKQLGRQLGFPTANMQTNARQIVPARGVYAVEALVGKSTYSGVCNIGCNPTFGIGPETIEVHLMGFEGDIYGETLDVIFCRRLRDEMVFESPEKLVEQIRDDLKRAAGKC